MRVVKMRWCSAAAEMSEYSYVQFETPNFAPTAKLSVLLSCKTLKTCSRI